MTQCLTPKMGGSILREGKCLMMSEERLSRTHRRFSSNFAAFMDHVRSKSSAVQPFDRSNLDELIFMYPMNAWLYFADATFERELAEAAEAVMRLVCLVPERIFHNNGQAIADFFGYANPDLAEMIFQAPNRMETVVARPDFLLTADGLKCLETNVSTNIGGANTKPWLDVHLQRPFMKEFLDRSELNLRFIDPMDYFFQHVLNLAVQMGLHGPNGELVVGMILPDSHPDKMLTVNYFQDLSDGYLERSGNATQVHYALVKNEDDLCIEADDLKMHGQRIGILLQVGGRGTSLELLRLHKRGGVHLLNGPAHRLMTDKRTLALLSMHADTPSFSAEERALIERYIPWTRNVAAGQVSFRGEQADLETLLREKPESFVLKRGQGYSGDSVVVGRQADRQRWEETIALAMSQGDWLVQEFLVSEPVLGMGEDGVLAAHELVLGLFCFGGRFSGTFTRSAPYHQGTGVINTSNGAVESVLVFEDPVSVCC